MAMTKTLATLAAAGTVAFAGSANAAFLNNWTLDVNGAAPGGAISVSEYVDLIGTSYIKNTFSSPTNFTFQDVGAFAVDRIDSGPRAPSDAEITGIFRGTGSGVLGGAISFDTTSTLELYSDASNNFGSTSGFYGANDGTLIGSFTLALGTGQIDPSGIPNGQLTLQFKATNLAAGYFFNENGVDLSTLVDSELLFGFVTTNASYVANPSSAVIDEIAGELFADQFGPGNVFTNTTPNDFVVSNNGQYRWTEVPEPGTIALLGLGLLGLSAVRRKQAK